MIAPELMEILRCPLDPSNTKVVLEGDKLVCERCQLAFPIKDGLPIMVVEEAELPAGCPNIEQLPCQRGGRKP